MDEIGRLSDMADCEVFTRFLFGKTERKVVG